MEDYEKKEDNEKGKDEIFSKVVRAGKRTYFFDVKSTKKDDYYLTITESKKHFNNDGTFSFEKHKLFLYKEDFEKFAEGLDEVVDFIKAHFSSSPSKGNSGDTRFSNSSEFSKVNFDDLDK